MISAFRTKTAAPTLTAVAILTLTGCAADGVLLPTLSPVIRANRDQIAEYFSTDFLPKKPQGTITESHVRILDDENATHSGNYRFALTAADGTRSAVEARFTYVYEKIDGRWLIVEHHSSAAPGRRPEHRPGVW